MQEFTGNPTAQLKGTWFDTSAVPSTIATTGLAENTTNDPLETEALAAAQHFGYSINEANGGQGACAVKRG